MSLFGGSTSTPSFGAPAAGSLFGNNQQQGQQGQPAAGAPAGSSLFGTKPPTFGVAASTASSAGTLFGAGAAGATSGAAGGGSLFGGGAAAPAAGGGLFGATTPAAGGGLFGGGAAAGAQQQAPAATQAGSSLFGAAATPAAGGAAAPAAGGFFGQAPAASGTPSLFGAAAAPAAGAGGSLFGGGAAAAPAAATTPSLFGATATQGAAASGTTPSLFGAPAAPPAAGSTPSLFGGGTAAAGSSLFGAKPATPGPAGGSLFGQTATQQPAGGLFGQTATQQPSGGLFGQTAAQQPAGGLFGQSTAQQPAGGLFGQTATQQPAGGLFGQTTTQQPAGGLFGPSVMPTSGTGLFGTTATTSSFARPTVPNGPGSADVQQQLMAQVDAMYGAWHSSSQTCVFQHFFYNLVAPEQVGLYQRPANWTNQALWERAMRENPDPTCMVPVLAIGFDDLKKRVEAQDRTQAEHQAKLKELSGRLEGLSQKHVLANAVRAQRAQTIQAQLALRILRLVQHLHLLLPSVRSSAIRPEEEQLRAALERVGDDLNRPAVKGKLNELWAAVQAVAAMRERERRATGGSASGTTAYQVVDEEGLKQITAVLREQQQGIAHIAETLEKDKRAVDVMETGQTAAALTSSASYGSSRNSLAASQMLRS